MAATVVLMICYANLFLELFSQGTHASAILALLLNKGLDGATSDACARLEAARAWQRREGCLGPWHS